jgi:hypothetical protein
MKGWIVGKIYPESISDPSFIWWTGESTNQGDPNWNCQRTLGQFLAYFTTVIQS